MKITWMHFVVAGSVILGMYFPSLALCLLSLAAWKFLETPKKVVEVVETLDYNTAVEMGKTKMKRSDTAKEVKRNGVAMKVAEDNRQKILRAFADGKTYYSIFVGFSYYDGFQYKLEKALGFGCVHLGFPFFVDVYVDEASVPTPDYSDF